MGFWNQQHFINKVRELYPDLQILTNLGEYYTANGLSVSFDDSFEDALHITPFTVDGEIPALDNVEVEFVELSSGYSDGGLSSDDPRVIRLYGELRVLLAQGGLKVVNSLQDYF